MSSSMLSFETWRTTVTSDTPFFDIFSSTSEAFSENMPASTAAQNCLSSTAAGRTNTV